MKRFAKILVGIMIAAAAFVMAPVTALAIPSLDIDITFSPEGPYDSGDSAQVSIKATNTGDVTITSATYAYFLNDYKMGQLVPYQFTNLEPGANRNLMGFTTEFSDQAAGQTITFKVEVYATLEGGEERTFIATHSYTINPLPVYSITFVDWDGSPLYVTTATKNQTPVYAGPAPTRQNSGATSYTFTGWSPDLGPATQPQTYTAAYNEETAKTDIANYTLDISWFSKEYNGANQVPTLTVKDGSTILQEGVDYTVTLYRDDDWNETPLTEAVDAGSYDFWITGRGAYEGEGFKLFDIDRRMVEIRVDDVTVAWTGSMLYGESEYYTDSVVSGHTATITYTPASGIDPGTYDNGSFADDFKVVDSDGNDVTANYKLQGKTPGKLTIEAPSTPSITDGDVTLSWTSTVYGGTSQVPDVTVTHGGSTLTPDTDYTVALLDGGNNSITEALHAGNYKLHISGKGD